MKTSDRSSSAAIRTVDVCQPLVPLADVQAYPVVRIFVLYNQRPLGSVDIANYYQPISVTRLCAAIVNRFAIKLLSADVGADEATFWNKARALLTQRYATGQPAAPSGGPLASLPIDVPVSVVVATQDRPDDLRACLRCLTAQRSTRRVEIIVVDNNPDSRLTPPVVAEFPGAILINEHRKGLSYARNAGFNASTGDIVIATDDDVTVPADWLEKLVAPFSRTDVMIVTGNVLPFELETRAQRMFETYGGLGRGFDSIEANGAWFDHFSRHAVPTWNLGATANAAFRSEIFNHPHIGLLDEALGAGTPTGCSEDTDLFYRVLKAGATIIYEPEAYVWHRHRRDMRALRKQIYNYSKGHVAYHLTTLLRDRDLRALHRLVLELPKAHAHRIVRRLRGKSAYPISLIALEIRGNLAGPLALWQARRRVRRLGRSAAYIPVPQRPRSIPKASGVEG
jgi:GT2 family glycosyltransferase